MLCRLNEDKHNIFVRSLLLGLHTNTYMLVSDLASRRSYYLAAAVGEVKQFGRLPATLGVSVFRVSGVGWG